MGGTHALDDGRAESALLEFQQAGPDPGLLMAEAERWEPRASLLADAGYQQLPDGEATIRISQDA